MLPPISSRPTPSPEPSGFVESLKKGAQNFAKLSSFEKIVTVTATIFASIPTLFIGGFFTFIACSNYFANRQIEKLNVQDPNPQNTTHQQAQKTDKTAQETLNVPTEKRSAESNIQQMIPRNNDHTYLRGLNTLDPQRSSLTEPTTKVASEFVSLESVDSSPPSKEAVAKEQQLATQREEFTKSVENGVISFKDLHGDDLSFQEKMGILLKKAPQGPQKEINILFTDVPDKKGNPTGQMRMIVKPSALFDADKTLLSQIKDPLYREELLSHADQNHYSFEFFDVAKQPEIDQKLKELAAQKQALDDLGGVLQNFMINNNVGAFNKSFTPAQRALFDIPHDQQLTKSQIDNLNDEYQDKLFMFPFTEESIKSELAKATISGRFSEDGSFGELRSVNIHSPNLGGKELMDFWDRFCGHMKPSEVYLEDDAKIEGKTGSYNLRLFRLMGLPDKGSWYTDGYQYHSYSKGSEGPVQTTLDSKEQQINCAAPFKAMTAAKAKELLEQPGMKPSNEAIKLLDQYALSDAKLGDIVKELGNRVRLGEQLHKELDTLLGVISIFSKYEGANKELNELKGKALVLTDSRFYRKSYD